MIYPGEYKRVAGIAVPLFSLRNHESSFSGNFSDLPVLGKWCKKAGISLIQILPVNDTGNDASPYAALNSLALHPVYIDLQSLPGIEAYSAEMQEFSNQEKNNERADYQSILTFIESITRRYFTDIFSKKQVTEFETWKKMNSWAQIYSIFKTLKTRNDQKPWWEWEKFRNPEELPVLTGSDKLEQEYHLFMQFQLDRQFTQASRKLEQMGVLLKGDIPILMGKDSADVWFYRKYFSLEKQAGAPPDMFSHEGQNWGFPVYDWSSLKKDNYSWWKERIRAADKYYHAFRIDHVLGFFRIWEISEKEDSGYSGYFNPQSFIHRRELQENGFDDGRITWLSNPHIAGHELRTELGDKASATAEKYLYRLENQDLYRIKDEYCSEKTIQGLIEADPIKLFLRNYHHQRTLIESTKGFFAPAWYYRDTYSYQSLQEEEKGRLAELIHSHSLKSESIWEKRATELLTMICGESKMRVCAEDLGVIFKGVGRVLNTLQIAGLRIVRWFREYDKEGEPPVSLQNYPENIVATLSVHDTSTLRGWYEETPDKKEIHEFFGIENPPAGTMPPEIAEIICGKLANSPANLVIFSAQDLFAMDKSLSEMLSPNAERINIPGTSDSFNWTYKIPVCLEKLISDFSSLTAKVKKVTAERQPKL